MQTCDSMDIGDIWDKSLQLFLCVIYTKVSLLEYCGVFPSYLAVFFYSYTHLFSLKHGHTSSE